MSQCRQQYTYHCILLKVGGTDQPHSEPKGIWNQTKQKYLTVIIATCIYQGNSPDTEHNPGSH